ncbi:hypothetical protein AgCh_015113 [Apium graveolens]
MGVCVYTFVCRCVTGIWIAKEHKQGELKTWASSTYELQRKLVQTILSSFTSGAEVQSSFSLVCPKSAVFQVVVHGGTFLGAAHAVVEPPKTTIFLVPDDIMILILSKLRIKYVIRFSSACRSWQRLISDRNFIDMYSSLDKSFLLTLSSSSSTLKKHPVPDFVDNSEYLVIPQFFEDRGVHLSYPWVFVGTANGLICLSDKYGRDIFLWSPLTKSYKQVPRLEEIDLFEDDIYFHLGFGVSKLGDFKVLSLVDDIFHIYSVSDDKWIEVHYLPPIGLSIGSSINGYFFLESQSMIFSFDLSRNDFQSIPLPEFFDTSLIYKKSPVFDIRVLYLFYLVLSL